MSAQLFACPFCGETHRSPNGTGGDVACCGEVGHCTCAHKWKFVSGWYGDQNVINGTADCSHWRCEWCDETTAKQPDEWGEPPEREHDYDHDRASTVFNQEIE